LTLRPFPGRIRRGRGRPGSFVFAGLKWGFVMLTWTLIFLVIALIAAVMGFTNIASESAKVTKVFFAIFVILFLVSFTMQLLS
jgi:uncharacterized membrane protein YtjA (UPF0391 family)